MTTNSSRTATHMRGLIIWTALITGLVVAAWSIHHFFLVTKAANRNADVYVNGQLLSVKAQTDNGTHMFIAAKPFLDAVVNKPVAFYCKNGTKSAKINNRPIKLPAACQQKEGRLFVPMRAVAEALGGTVGTQSNGAVVTVSSQKKTKVQVTRVVDGDTIVVKWNGVEEKVRLIGVDTPETVHPRLGEEPYGRAASNFTKSRLTGKSVWLESDVEVRDRYSRLLGYIYLSDGSFFNAMLVAEGYAQMSTYPPNVRWVNLYRTLQTSARQQSRGLWKLENTTDGSKPPSEELPFKESPSGCKTPQIKGNINSSGDKIYHLPGGDYYASTQAEQMFCNEADAVRAGFRKSKR